MSDRWRCFVAVPIDDDLREELRAAVDRWRERGELAGLRWTDPDGWHLTLAFLGGIDPADVPRLAASLEDGLRVRGGSEHATGGVGGFPSAARARVAWYGVADPDRRLRELAAVVRRAVDLPEEDPFRAHVTLARARADRVDLRKWAASAQAPIGRLLVDRVELMRSHLGRGPARYESLATVRLGVPAHV